MKNCAFLKNNAKPMFAAGMLALMGGGCVTSQTQQANTEKINYILDLQKQGVITAEQSLNLIRRVSDVSSTAPLAQAAARPSDAGKSAVAPVVAAPAPVQKVWSYKPETILQGRLRSVGSDTMDKLIARWEGDFLQHHTALLFFHEGKGSSTAVPALSERRADFGPMSRMLKEKEIAEFTRKFGYAPIQLKTAVDCIAVFLHPDNPLVEKGISLKELDAIFSAECLRGGKSVKTWGDLGLTGEWINAPIKVYSRNNASGTHAFFKKAVLKKGAYRRDAVMLPGSEGIVKAVSTDKFSIGYSGIGFKTKSVAVAPLANEAGEEFFPPEAMYAYSEQYPLARFLYLTVKRDPSRNPSPLQKEFMSYIFSKDGQEQVAAEGFFPLSTKVIKEEMKKLGLISSVASM